MTHHAYIYEGPLALLGALANDARERFGFDALHNPDVQVLTHEKFGIEEARALQNTAALKSISGRGLFVIGVSSITSESQQALLKLFEEPQEGVVFVLLVPYGTVIATLRSRFLPYPVAVEGEAKRISVKTFLAAPYKVRSAEVAKLLKDDEGVRERVREFLHELEYVLHAALAKKKGEKALLEGLADIAKVRSYTNDRSASFKMLLEHLALSLPKI